jgi:hypothetical protein
VKHLWPHTNGLPLVQRLDLDVYAAQLLAAALVCLACARCCRAPAARKRKAA